MTLLKSLLNLVIVLTVVSHSLLLVSPAVASPGKLNLAGQAQSLTVNSRNLPHPKIQSSVLAEKYDGSLAPAAIPLEQGQTITRTWNFESGPEGWMPLDGGTGSGLSFWEQTPPEGPDMGVWRANVNSSRRIHIYIWYPYRVSVDQIKVKFHTRTYGLNLGGGRALIYESDNGTNWTEVARSSNYPDQASGTKTLQANIDDKYVRVYVDLAGPLFKNAYGYLDDVTFVNCIGCDPQTPSVNLDILDPTGTPVTQVITNTDGWPTPNPLTVQMSITNTTGITLTNPALVLSIDSPYTVGEYEGRFYVMETNGFDTGVYGVSGVQYKVITDTASLAISQTTVLTAQVWIQPSVTTTLEFAAELYTNSGAIGQDDPLGQATKLVNVPQAKIHPVVIIPGFLGTFPPEHGGKLDPLTQIYDNLIAGLERAGYEAGLAGSGATLIPFGYDWRQPLGDTGRVALRNDIEAIQNSSNQRDYVDYSQVDIIAHSAGGLVSRAYIEDSSANNDQNVNRLITLATPHKGTLAAYRGWYGGDPTGILPINEFRSLLNVLLVCKGLAVQSVFEEDEALAEEDYYTYFRTEVPSVPDLLPQASGLPQPYLTARTPTGCSGGPDYCYGTPPNPFLNDLNSSGGQYEVTKLQNVPITSSYRLDRPDLTEGRYEVDPPPTSPPNDQPELWRYGKINESYVNNVSGDIVVPDFSGDLTDVVSYSNIQGQDETIGATVSQLPHVTINNEPIMVRRVISYVTGIDVPENFWQEEWSRSDYDIDDAIAFLSCNPIFRQLVTDPLGRRVGFSLEDGQVINDVSEAFVSEAGSIPQLILLPRIEGEYQVQGISELPGDFQVGALRTNTTGSVIMRIITGTTTIGQAYQYSVGQAPFEENDGQVVFEAESFVAQIGHSDRTWLTQTVLSGYSGTSYISTGLDIGQIFTDTYVAISPEVQFKINFTTPGTYRLWLRGYASDAGGDSVYVRLAGQSDIMTSFAPRTWSWVSSEGGSTPTTFTITEAGIYTLHLWQREDGIKIDRVLMTTDESYIPSGNGP